MGSNTSKVPHYCIMQLNQKIHLTFKIKGLEKQNANKSKQKDKILHLDMIIPSGGHC